MPAIAWFAPPAIRYDRGMSSSEDGTNTAQEIRDLEARVAYQDKLLIDLDEVLRSFCQRVERLERHITELRDSVAAPEFGPGDEKPPHY